MDAPVLVGGVHRDCSDAFVGGHGHDGPHEALDGVLGRVFRHLQAVYPAFRAFPVAGRPYIPLAVHRHQAPASVVLNLFADDPDHGPRMGGARLTVTVANPEDY